MCQPVLQSFDDIGVSGLHSGADDYVTKPFQIEELLARMRALLRHRATRETDDERSSLADLEVNFKTRDVMRNKMPISLTPREYDLLVYLLQNQNQVLTREQILRHVWGYEYYGDTNVVDVYIRYLRKKIDQGFMLALIHTVRCVGYSMREP